MESITITVDWSNGNDETWNIGAIVDSAASKVFLLNFGEDIEREGLVVLYRHTEVQMPDENDFSYKPDPRGYPCAAKGDGFDVILTPEEVKEVDRIYKNDQIIFERIGGKLVNLRRVNQLVSRYFKETEQAGVCGAIAAVYQAMTRERKYRLANSIENMGSPEEELEHIANEMKLPADVVKWALEDERQRKLEDKQVEVVIENEDEDENFGYAELETE